jgi:hypothetical protein
MVEVESCFQGSILWILISAENFTNKF